MKSSCVSLLVLHAGVEVHRKLFDGKCDHFGSFLKISLNFEEIEGSIK